MIIETNTPGSDLIGVTAADSCFAPVAACCAAEVQETCCEPAQKADCCGTASFGGGCGCQ